MAEQLVYKRADGKWAWNLKADNGQIVATDGGQGYNNEADAQQMADAVVSGAFSSRKRLRRG